MLNSKSLPVLLLLLIVLTAVRTVESQPLRIVAVNTFTGAVTGAALGGATIALQNKSDNDYYPLRFGIGMGTIMGVGTGFYDWSQAAGDGYYVDGAISSTGTTGTLILLDTFYGAATGAIVGTAVSLMTESKIVKGVQFGSATGAWVGFAFGLFDAFVLSSQSGYDSFYDDYTNASGSMSNPATAGFIQLKDDKDRFAVGLLNPMMYQSVDFSPGNDITGKTSLGVEFTRISISL